MAEDRKAVRVRVAGRVQGVWFRGWTRQTAAGFGLTGWVRNRADGSVEALFAGPAFAVDRMVEACRRGPPSADVRHLEVESAADPGLDRFEQRGTL
jgi:acylphosphatase